MEHTQQSTDYQGRNRGERELHCESAMHNRDKLGLQGLSEGFFRCLQNQSLTDKPNIRQFKYCLFGVDRIIFFLFSYFMSDLAWY